jgi:hypothetical protein
LWCWEKEELVTVSFMRDMCQDKERFVLSCSGREPDEVCDERCLNGASAK